MLKAISALRLEDPLVDVMGTAQFILKVQKKDGEIPWSVGGKTDPWDHVESAMGLTSAGYTDAACKAYEWSRRTQLADGSWWSYCRNGRPEPDAYKDANMTAYIAVGVYHYYLATHDDAFLQTMWPTVCKAIDFVLRMQDPEGPVYWAQKKDGGIEKRALLTGSSSIYLSLGCALRLADLLGFPQPAWKAARFKLGQAIARKPHLFDQSKARFSMDWYYPILCGAVTGEAARKRIETAWERFIVAGWGVKCVSDQPWLTMAETAELVLALGAMEEFDTAIRVFQWLCDKQYDDGAFWTGVTYPDRVIYTEEKTAWTGAAVLLATDLLYGLTPAGLLFSHRFWHEHENSRKAALSK